MPITYKRPGTYVEEVGVPQRIAAQNFDVALGAFVGAAERGQTNEAVLIQSWSDFNKAFGGFRGTTSSSLPLANAVYQFFSNNGRACYVKRVVGDGATAAAITLKDTLANNVLTVTAKSAGAWAIPTASGNGLYILVQNTTPSIAVSSWVITDLAVTVTTATPHNFSVGDSVYVYGVNSNINGKRLVTAVNGLTFSFTITSGSNNNGSGAGTVSPNPETFSLSVYYNGTSAGNLVERFTDLTLSPASDRYAVTVVNSNSTWVTLSVSGFTNTGDLAPASSSGGLPQSFSGGSDGSAITAENMTAAASAFDAIQQNLVFNIPDSAYMSQANHLTVMNYYLSMIDDRGDSFLVVDTPESVTTATNATTFTASLTPNSPNAATYFPWVTVPDPSASAAGSLKTMPPGGSVTGYILSNDSVNGVYKAPAGIGAQLRNVVATSVNLTSANLDTLNTAIYPVNAIRPVPGSGICIMGARTISTDRANRYVNTRRTLLQVKKALADITAFAVFESNNPLLWDRITTVCTVYLNELWQAGGLKGVTAAQAFYVVCDESINTAESIAEGALNIEVGVSLQTPAEFVIIRIGQFDGNTSVSIQE